MLVRIVGQAPLEATVYELERLRCNACGQVFTADEPEGVGSGEVRRDGGGDDRAAEVRQRECRSIAWNGWRGIWGFRCRRRRSGSLMEAAAKLIQPALDELIRQAAQGEVLHNDDTGMRVLRLAREPGDKRTGVFTSGIVSIGQGRTDRAVLHRTEARGREPRRGAETARARSCRRRSRCAMPCRATCRNCRRRRDPAGELPRALSGLWNYPERMRDSARQAEAGNGVSGMLTPDKASQTFEECEQLWRWPPLSRSRRVKPGSLPKGLQHLALHLKIGRNVSACGGHRCMTEIIANHRNIDTRLQKRNGTTVSHDVWSDSALS